MRETALFYVRQRTQDLLTQMAVSVQGYLALDLVKKNNVELVKGVDRASTTTVGALRTAVTVAQAMTNQRLVLGQITALNPIEAVTEGSGGSDRLLAPMPGVVVSVNAGIGDAISEGQTLLTIESMKLQICCTKSRQT